MSENSRCKECIKDNTPSCFYSRNSIAGNNCTNFTSSQRSSLVNTINFAEKELNKIQLLEFEIKKLRKSNKMLIDNMRYIRDNIKYYIHCGEVAKQCLKDIKRWR